MKKFITSFVSILMLVSMSAVQAQNKKTDQKKMDRQEQVQMQEKMAKLHGDTASCLKDSDKTVETCKSEMMKNCSMGEMHCKMMGNMMTDDMSMMDHSMMNMDGMNGKKKKVNKE